MKRLLPFLFLGAICASPCAAIEIKKDGWLFPNPGAAEKQAIRTADLTSRIPGKETLVKIYKRKKDGVIFETFEVEGEVYACQFQIKGEEGKPPTVYAIVDTDGDGIYESKYAAGEKPHTPEWVIQRYYKKHPEQKDPGPSSESPAPKR
jgi:uncharacterized protein DUF2782